MVIIKGRCAEAHAESVDQIQGPSSLSNDVSLAALTLYDPLVALRQHRAPAKVSRFKMACAHL